MRLLPPDALPRRAAAAGLAIAILAAACTAGPGAPSATDDPAGSPSPRPTPNREMSIPPGDRVPQDSAPPVTGEVPETLIAAVRDDLAARLGRDASGATVVVAEQVVWPDGSLGCPEPGMMYTQALVDGYRVVVELDGTRYDYRAGEQGAVRLCERPVPIQRP